MLQIHNLRKGDFRGVGIAFPGIVDSKRKKILSTLDKYEDGMSTDMYAWCKEAFGLPLDVENDANAALIGEITNGSAKGETDAVLVTLGTGIGTAAMMGGKLIRGKHYQAGSLGGHMTVRVGGRRCVCGNIGCAEGCASTWSLPIIAREHPLFMRSGLHLEEVIDFMALFKWLERDDTLAQILFEEIMECWSAVIINMIHAYDPEVVILSGGVMKAGDKIALPLMEKVWDRAWSAWGKVRFCQSAAPQDSVLLGLDALLEGE